MCNENGGFCQISLKILIFFKNGFKKKSALGGFGLEGFWIAQTINLMDFGVPKMGFLVLVLGVIERGVVCILMKF